MNLTRNSSSRLIALAASAASLAATPAYSQLGGIGSVHGHRLHAEYIDGVSVGRNSVANLGDLDGNGVSDMVWNHGSNPTRVIVALFEADGSIGSYQEVGSGAGGFGGSVSSLDMFGNSIAGIGDLDGDGTPDLAIGAPRDVVNNVQYGSVWVVFLNPDGTAKDEFLISDATGGFGGNLRNGDVFGWAVASPGDVNGDGVPDLAVGANGTPGAAGSEGFAWGAVWILFMNPDGTVASEQLINATNGGFGGQLSTFYAFGSALAPLGDFDGDGVGDLAVTANGWRDSSGNPMGAVWVLLLNADGTVHYDQEISTEAGGFTGDLDPYDAFGYRLASPGDIDGDGVMDLAASARDDDDGSSDPNADHGAIWMLFLNADGTVKSHQKISKTEGYFDGDTLTYFGGSMDSVGDLDGDGVADLIASSSIYDDVGNVRSGLWKLFLDDGVVSAGFVYGSGVNPDDSMVEVSGRPSLGTTLTLGLDNPLGTQASGATSLVVVSLAPSPSFPAGDLVPGFGMSGPGAAGELLIGVQPQDLVPPAWFGPAWTGAGQPSQVDIPIPNDANLLGLSVYAQGILIDPTVTFGIRFGLTDAIELRFGL